MRTRWLIVLFLPGCSASSSESPCLSADPATNAPDLIRRAAAANDEGLIELFRRAFQQRNEYSEGLNPLEVCLCEMIRRGGARWEATIRRAFDEVARTKPDIEEEARDLELLAALRRIQGRRDPLILEVRTERELESSAPDLPEVTVALKNADPEGVLYRYTKGGNYRTGRWARWRFEVRDAAGREMPIIDQYGFFGGGMYVRDTLKPGDSWCATLAMHKYVRPLPPGRYSVRVQYSDRACISEYTDIRGSIVFESKLLHLTVRMREIEFSAAERAEMKGWISGLEKAGPLKILAGSYSERVHDFIPPDSPPGRLLTMGWKAVPPLIEALSSDLRSEGASWALSILFSITGLENPTKVDGAVGDYELRSAPWSLLSTSNGHYGGGVLRATKEDSTHRGKVDLGVQSEFIRRWRERARFFVVREK